MRKTISTGKKLFLTSAGVSLTLFLWAISTLATQAPSRAAPLAYEGTRPYTLRLPWGLDTRALRIPRDNPITEEKVALGKLLFFDRRLSADGTVACADCHNPKLAFTDGKPVATGIRGQAGGRCAPTIINRAFSTAQFWDGRAPSLEEQAKGPLLNPIEMGNASYGEVVARLRRIRGYRALFEEAFGTEDFTIDHVAKAIATFERTVLSGNAPFDRFQQGYRAALSSTAERGFRLFAGKARCITCHSGPNFTDEQFHKIGLGYEKSTTDFGRYLVTRREADKGRFKTPTLREIANTAPYMHDGRFKTLEEVVDFYSRGGLPETGESYGQDFNINYACLPITIPRFKVRRPKNPESELDPLDLSQEEKQDLVEFLKSLSGLGWQQIEPPEQFPD